MVLVLRWLSAVAWGLSVATRVVDSLRDEI